MPAPAPIYATASTAAPPSGPPRSRMVLYAALVVIVAFAIGAGAALALRDSSKDTQASPSITVEGDAAGRGDLAVDADATVTTLAEGNAPILATTTASTTTTMPAATTTSAPPVTSPPVSPPSSAPRGASVFRDDSHLVRLTIPTSFITDQGFDGGTARWSGEGVVIVYEVVPGAGLSDADARESGLVAALARVTYNPPAPSTAGLDGRYVVAGQATDGSYLYERGKIRCGDLVRYRLQWTGPAIHPVADALANRWYNDDPALDAMGDVHAVC